MNDWMDQEVLRQAAEAGDPSAQTASWAIPARRQLPAVQLFLVLAVLSLIVVLTVVAAAALR